MVYVLGGMHSAAGKFIPRFYARKKVWECVDDPDILESILVAMILLVLFAVVIVDLMNSKLNIWLIDEGTPFENFFFFLYVILLRLYYIYVVKRKQNMFS